MTEEREKELDRLTREEISKQMKVPANMVSTSTELYKNTYKQMESRLPSNWSKNSNINSNVNLNIKSNDNNKKDLSKYAKVNLGPIDNYESDSNESDDLKDESISNDDNDYDNDDEYNDYNEQKLIDTTRIKHKILKK